MSFQNQIEKFSKSRLKNVETIVTTVEGKKLLERKELDAANGQTIIVDTGQRTLGFCEDTNPDSNLYRIKRNLFVSSQDGASNYEQLKENQITHILNVATGVENAFPGEFIYKNIELLDLPETDIEKHFSEVFEFIGSGCAEGAVLVHCNAGISRSCTAVIAYLMYDEGMSFQDAFQLVRTVRPGAKPNDGFMKQLQQFKHKQAPIKQSKQ